MLFGCQGNNLFQNRVTATHLDCPSWYPRWLKGSSCTCFELIDMPAQHQVSPIFSDVWSEPIQTYPCKNKQWYIHLCKLESFTHLKCCSIFRLIPLIARKHHVVNESPHHPRLNVEKEGWNSTTDHSDRQWLTCTASNHLILLSFVKSPLSRNSRPVEGKSWVSF